MMNIEFLPSARREQVELIEYFNSTEDQAAGYGLKFLQRIDELLARVQIMPLLYRDWAGGVRIVSLASPFGEYFLSYIVQQQSIVVLAIGHGKRTPLYFASRISGVEKIPGGKKSTN